MFPNRINVQFAKVINRNEVEILIWERGADLHWHQELHPVQ